MPDHAGNHAERTAGPSAGPTACPAAGYDGGSPACPTVTLTGWGRLAPTNAQVCQPLSPGQVASLLREAPPRGVIARGLGRSYNNAAQNDRGMVITTAAMNRICELDASQRPGDLRGRRQPGAAHGRRTAQRLVRAGVTWHQAGDHRRSHRRGRAWQEPSPGRQLLPPRSVVRPAPAGRQRAARNPRPATRCCSGRPQAEWA